MGVGRRPSGSRPSGSGYGNAVGVAVRRSSEPSGHWVDAYGSPCASPNKPYVNYPETAPRAPTNGNPDSNNWKIIKASEGDLGRYLILLIQYPDCTNYEGKKILVYENVKLIDLVNQKLIDPHFFPKNNKFKSPIARFEPTDRGWKMAEKFVKTL